MPYAYITGTKEFMGINFKVNEDVLIPRDDTEILVSKVIELIKEKTNDSIIKILDMCTGSGCIAISIAHEFKNRNISVWATDISADALNVAKENALANDAKINFIQSDLFSELTNKFDIIVSNPPYIKSKVINSLQREVKDNEPLIALDGGEDGLDFYKRISNDAKNYLNNNGILAFEIGFDQKEEIIKILQDEGYTNIEAYTDYSGNDRVVIGTLNN